MLSITPVSFTANNDQRQNNGLSGGAATAAGTVAAVSKPVNDAAKLAKLRTLEKNTINTINYANSQLSGFQKLLGRVTNAFKMYSGKASTWFSGLKAFSWIKPVIKSPIGKAVGSVVGGVIAAVVLIDGIGQMCRAVDHVQEKLSD